jgi:hypothetical protein
MGVENVLCRLCEKSFESGQIERFDTEDTDSDEPRILTLLAKAGFSFVIEIRIHSSRFLREGRSELDAYLMRVLERLETWRPRSRPAIFAGSLGMEEALSRACPRSG